MPTQVARLDDLIFWLMKQRERPLTIWEQPQLSFDITVYPMHSHG